MAGEVTDQLIEHLRARSEFGQVKYGRYMEPFDGRDTLLDALEEALDLAQYLQKALMERDQLKSDIAHLLVFHQPTMTQPVRATLSTWLGRLNSDTAERHTHRP